MNDVILYCLLDYLQVFSALRYSLNAEILHNLLDYFQVFGTLTYSMNAITFGTTQTPAPL